MTVAYRGLQPLGLADQIRLGTEILSAYARVRWLLRGRDAVVVVARLRAPARRSSPSGGAAGAAPPAEALLVGGRLAHAVTRVLRPLPTDVRCLSQSLTLLTVMERRDLHPALVIAVRPRPFSAHAWIELAGQPLLAPADPDHERLTEL